MISDNGTNTEFYYLIINKNSNVAYRYETLEEAKENFNYLRDMYILEVGICRTIVYSMPLEDIKEVRI